MPACLASVAVFFLLAGSAQAVEFGFNEAWGHNELSPETDARLSQMEADAGGEVHRLVVQWDDVEHQEGVFDWRYYDRVIDNVEAAGMRPLIVIMNAPRWAQTPFECQGEICPPAPNRLDDWARFAYEVTLRYPQAAAIEVWNEPNGRGQWVTAAGPDPERFASVFNSAAGAIHFANPTMPVIVGSVTYWLEDDRYHMTIPKFVERFYRAGGGAQLRPEIDGIGLHAYPWITELTTLDGPFSTILSQMRGELARFDPTRKIWMTETGVTTSGRYAVTRREQALGILTLATVVPTMPDIAALTIHSSIEAPADRNSPDDPGYGLVSRQELEPSLAYCALAELHGTSTSTTGCRSGILDDLGWENGGPDCEDGGGTDTDGDGDCDCVDAGGIDADGDGDCDCEDQGGTDTDGDGDCDCVDAGGIDVDGDGKCDRDLRREARKHCRAKHSAAPWWPFATRKERRHKMQNCTRRYIRRHS